MILDGPRGFHDQDSMYIHAFLNHLSVPSLKASVLQSSSTPLFQYCPELQQYFGAVVPWIQRLLYQEYHHVYTAWIQSNIVEKLDKMQFGMVSNDNDKGFV